MNSHAPTPVQNHPTPTERPRRQVSHDDIARRAEQLWHERNRPADQDEKIWLEAESELQAKAESRPVSGTPSRPYQDEPATPVRSGTKSSDPSEAGAQTRSATENKAQARQTSPGKIRNQ